MKKKVRKKERKKQLLLMVRKKVGIRPTSGGMVHGDLVVRGSQKEEGGGKFTRAAGGKDQRHGMVLGQGKKAAALRARKGELTKEKSRHLSFTQNRRTFLFFCRKQPFSSGRKLYNEKGRICYLRERAVLDWGQSTMHKSPIQLRGKGAGCGKDRRSVIVKGASLASFRRRKRRKG